MATTPERDSSTGTDPLWTVEGLGQYLGVPTSTIYQWRARREGPLGIKVGRYVRFRPADVEAWLAERAKAS